MTPGSTPHPCKFSGGLVDPQPRIPGSTCTSSFLALGSFNKNSQQNGSLLLHPTRSLSRLKTFTWRMRVGVSHWTANVAALP